MFGCFAGTAGIEPADAYTAKMCRAATTLCPNSPTFLFGRKSKSSKTSLAEEVGFEPTTNIHQIKYILLPIRFTSL